MAVGYVYGGTVEDADSISVRTVGGGTLAADVGSNASNTVEIRADWNAFSSIRVEFVVGEAIGTGGLIASHAVRYCTVGC